VCLFLFLFVFFFFLLFCGGVGWVGCWFFGVFVFFLVWCLVFFFFGFWEVGTDVEGMVVSFPLSTSVLTSWFFFFFFLLCGLLCFFFFFFFFFFGGGWIFCTFRPDTHRLQSEPRAGLPPVPSTTRGGQGLNLPLFFPESAVLVPSATPAGPDRRYPIPE